MRDDAYNGPRVSARCRRCGCRYALPTTRKSVLGWLRSRLEVNRTARLCLIGCGGLTRRQVAAYQWSRVTIRIGGVLAFLPAVLFIVAGQAVLGHRVVVCVMDAVDWVLGGRAAARYARGWS